MNPKKELLWSLWAEPAIQCFEETQSVTVATPEVH